MSAHCDPSKHTPRCVDIDMKPLAVQEYYIGEIPADRAPVYAVLGIKYVCVRCKDLTYYVYAGALSRVVEELGLYA